MSEFVVEEKVGVLGVPHLRRLWSSWTRRTQAPADKRAAAQEWERNNILIHGLGVGMEPLARFLSVDRSFEQFEAWILGLNGGSIEAERIARLNAALSGGAYDAPLARGLERIARMPAVLDEADLQFWNRHGYVVLRGAISAGECAAAAAAVREFVGAHPDDAQTWYRREHLQGVMAQLFQHPALEPARRSARIHKAFAQLWGEVDLLPTMDRCGFNPPERPGFAFPGPRLHWDAELNPPVGLGIQGVLYLTDTAAEQGAFTCVPGFHHSLDAWLRELPPGADPHERIPHDAVIAVAGGAGDMVLWHHGLPHGGSPNRAAKPRIVQYLTFFPARPRIAAGGSASMQE